jgi:N-acetylneuraminic acid mutarotase
MKRSRIVQTHPTIHSNRFVLMLLLLASLTALANDATWQQMASMLKSETGPAVGVINGIVYSAGGFHGGQGPTADLQAFNPASNSWTRLASMPAARYNGNGTGVINSQLYVAGGFSATFAPTDTLFLFDPKGGSWKQLARMSHLSACGASGVIDSKLYVTTACDGRGGATNYLDVYDPATGQWTSLTPTSRDHQDPAAGVINGQLYVAGGFDRHGNPSPILESYNPATNTWTTLAPMHFPVGLASGAVIDGKFIVFAGYNGRNDSNTVQVYDPFKNRWFVTKPLVPVAADSMGSGVVDDIPIILGGVNDVGRTLNVTFMYFLCPSLP